MMILVNPLLHPCHRISLFIRTGSVEDRLAGSSNKEAADFEVRSLDFFNLIYLIIKQTSTAMTVDFCCVVKREAYYPFAFT